MNMKRLTALLLALLLVLSILPTSFAARPEPEQQDIWDQIARIEDQAARRTRAADTEARAAAYAGAVDRIAEAVTASSDYVSGSLIRNGDHLFWDRKDGTGCGYSPRLRARIRESAKPQADPEAYAGIVTSSYELNGGSPGSASVAAFQPYIGIDTSFTNQYEQRCNSIAQALGGVGTTYKTNDATIDNIANALETCAVVIFDSHGDTDFASGYDYTSRANTSYICLQSGAGFTTEDQQTVQGPYGSYKHAYYGGSNGSMQFYMADGTAISNHMDGESPNGLLWMAICLGMATDGLHMPLRAKGVEVAYGYSQSVTFAGDYAWEGVFWPQMIQGSNVKDAIAAMKQQVGIKDPYTSSYPAWPIVVSSEDVYPGHGNVDKAQTVNSTWTLYPQYTVTALSNNPDWGTVRVNGTKVIATPKEGYYVDDYELVEGAAQVTRSGNVFSLTPESDCTIRILFAPRDPAVLNFSVPEGVSCDPIEAFVGDMIELPVPSGEPSAEGYDFHFLGWLSAPMEDDSMELPAFLKAGTQVKLSQVNTTYYALYSYFVAQDGLDDDQFLRVDEAPASWTGEYVISYNGEYALGASRSAVGSNLGNTKAVVDLAELGCTVEGNILNGVTEKITWVVEPSQDGSYTVKMKCANYFLALAGDTDSLTSYTSSNTDKTRWTLTMGANGPVFTNKAYENRFLQYNSGSKLFRCYTSAKQPLTLFAKADGDTWYTTAPKDKVLCDEHQFGDWQQDKAPGCVEAGQRSRYCSVCGFKQTESIDPLGHAWSEWTQIQAPSCQETGLERRACARCLETETRELPLADDSPVEPVKESEVPASCTEAGGYDLVTRCAVCGQLLSREHHEEPALGHDWDEGVVTLEPTETEPGVKTYTCTRCGETKTEEIPATGHVCPCAAFTDMPEYGTPEHEAIDWAYTHQPYQITSGSTATSFGTDKTVSRAQAMTFLWIASGKPEPKTKTSPFTDVKDGKYYTKAVLWAVENKITSGTSATKFSPNKTCNRSEIIGFLYAALGKPAHGSEIPFSDVSGKWFQESAIWAYEQGIERGENGVYSPKTPCTRASTVLYLYRALEGKALAK